MVDLMTGLAAVAIDIAATNAIAFGTRAATAKFCKDPEVKKWIDICVPAAGCVAVSAATGFLLCGNDEEIIDLTGTSETDSDQTDQMDDFQITQYII